jgi:hypothetical protein
MSKSEVYSWRLTPELKAELEEAARIEKTSVGRLLERTMLEWLEGQKPARGKGEQRRLRRELMGFAGAFHGDGTSATNVNVRAVITTGLEARYGRSRSD